ncbi:MAG: aminoglycoside phosphotransferase family protein [Verrucomicrobia bacterium]|nr:aminoglycoside phosphotransferase family protein [Verrucomicrobiota bacterium]
MTRAQASTLLGHWLGRETDCREVEPLHGGICSAVFRLQFETPPYVSVVKLQADNEDDPLPRECRKLEHLHQHTAVPCPRVYLQDTSRTIIPYSFLLMECLAGTNLEAVHLSASSRRTVERELAETLLELHSHTAEVFHETGQSEGVRQWANVFLPTLDENRRDMDSLLSDALLRKLDTVLPLAETAFRNQGAPTLIHNDVWAGNIIVDERANGWHLSGLIDPVGLQYADVEKELAYLEVFNTVGDEFFRTYTAARPLRTGYEHRKLFYWLDTCMTHVWLGFGPEFHDRIAKTCADILAAY